jgi:hypothetical protein
MLMIEVIEPTRVQWVWPLVLRHIERSQARGPSDMTVKEIRYRVENDPAWRLVIFEEACAAAVIRLWDNRLHVVAIGGHLPKGWHHDFFDWLKRCARFCECTSVTLGGRRGWARLLKPLGFVDIGGPYIGVQIS